MGCAAVPSPAAVENGKDARDVRRRDAVALGALGIGAAALLLVLLGGSSKHPRQAQSGPTPPTTRTIQTATAPAPSNPSAKPGPAPSNPPAKPAPATIAFGASVNRLFNDLTYTPQEIDEQLKALRATGATIARSDTLWEATEPSEPRGVHHYDWRFDDWIAGSLAAHDMRWLPIIDYTAPWAESVPGKEQSPPTNPNDYAAYAAAFAARYGPGGSFWAAHSTLTPEPIDTYEIWNEPDIQPFWAPSPDLPRYAQLYVAARDAILRVDPGARVIIGGLAHPVASLPALLRARPDLRGHLDGVGIHPYARTPAQVLAGVRAVRRVLVSLGLAGVPVYITEFGWSTRPVDAAKFAAAQVRPSYIETTLDSLGHVSCGIAAVVLYTWVTPERDPGNVEDWFGIHRPTGGGTPDTRAFAAGLTRATAGAASARATARAGGCL
jgi:hypothetical protein